MPREIDPNVRNSVILHYSPSMMCACCDQDERGYLNVVPVRLNADGKQEFDRQDVPTPDRLWEQLFDREMPSGYAIYCSNCIVSHPLGLCPHVVG